MQDKDLLDKVEHVATSHAAYFEVGANSLVSYDTEEKEWTYSEGPDWHKCLRFGTLREALEQAIDPPPKGWQKELGKVPKDSTQQDQKLDDPRHGLAAELKRTLG